MQLRKLALEIDLANQLPLRYAFALSCAQRIRHLLIDPQLLDLLATAVDDLRRKDYAVMQQHASLAASMAASHRGTNSGDGAGSAAVSASYALAKALAGDAVNAAEYAAYALVYSYASHTVTNPEAYQQEYAWQVRELRHNANLGGD